MEVLLLYGLGAFGGLTAVAALLAPRRAFALSLIAAAATILALSGWIVYRILLRAGLFVPLAGDEPGLNGLAALGVTTVLLALASIVRPRRWLLGVSALGLVATIAGCLGALHSIHGSILDSLFVADGEGMTRAAIELDPAAVHRHYEGQGPVLLFTAHVLLLGTVLLAAAGVRMRLWRGLGAVSVALPVLMIGRMVIVQALSTRNPFRCVLGGFDPTPIDEQMLLCFAEEALVIPLGGLVAAVLAVIAAVREARAGRVVGDRALAAAGVVFLVGASLYLVTRPVAEDLARGPRRAFVGKAGHVPGGIPRPFGEVAVDWTAPGWIEPPSVVDCALIGPNDIAPRLVLELDGAGVRAEEYDEFGLEPRGLEGWHRDLVRDLEGEEGLWIDLVIDRRAPLAKVRPFLLEIPDEGADLLRIVTDRRLSERTRTFGDVGVRKRCEVAVLTKDEILAASLEPETWGDLVASPAIRGR